MIVKKKPYRTIWMEGTDVKMINQLGLPFSFSIFTSTSYQQTAHAIRTMVVRGAGAIGAAAGFAMAQAALAAPDSGYETSLAQASETIKATRPTAYDLFYSVDRVLKAALTSREEAVNEAQKLANLNVQAAKAIGNSGLPLFSQNTRVLTHCNAGWLAFVDWGTALSPIYLASRQNLNPFVWVGETRPRGQGARLTAWELHNENIQHKVIADNTVASLMSQGKIDLVITGADRIARNGDAANKTGTLDRAILAKHFNIPFYIAAPSSTFDPSCPDGQAIPIETRGDDEVTHQTGPDSSGQTHTIAVVNTESSVYNPSFDVTPSNLITGFITEQGIITPNEQNISQFLSA